MACYRSTRGCCSPSAPSYTAPRARNVLDLRLTGPATGTCPLMTTQPEPADNHVSEQADADVPTSDDLDDAASDAPVDKDSQSDRAN